MKCGCRGGAKPNLNRRAEAFLAFPKMNGLGRRRGDDRHLSRTPLFTYRYAMSRWPALPADVVDWFRSAFAEANSAATSRLLNVPNIHEPALDDALIEALIPLSPPRLLPSGAVVEMNIHNIGGLRRFHHWETADIAIIVFVYQTGSLLAQKIGLLQSKRLYPSNHDVDDGDPVDFAYGMNKFLRRDPKSVLSRLHRQFDFDNNCIYAALEAGSEQIAAMANFTAQFGEALYYLLYNPPSLPVTVRYPVTAKQIVEFPSLGCRVFTVADIDRALSPLPANTAPTFQQVQGAKPASDWRLEHWAADLLLSCRVGRQFDPSDESLVSNLLVRRSGPIGAAIAISIELGPAGG